MGLVIEDADKELAMPKPKMIRISGFNDGKADPKLYDGERLTWHAQIPLSTPGVRISLVQGHGSSIRQAIANGVIEARQYLASFSAELARLEDAIGCRGMTDEQLRRDVID